jgi:hypothetical protein
VSALLVLLLAGGAATVIAAREVSGGSETAATHRLEARLPAAVFGSCHAGSAEDGVSAVVDCAGSDPRVAAIEVRQLPNSAALAARFRSLSDDLHLVNRRCAGETGNSGGFWTSAGNRQGAFACYSDDEHRRLFWQYDAQAIEVQASADSDTPAAARDLYDWWSTVARNRPLAG